MLYCVLFLFLLKKVRVCDGCFTELQKPAAAGGAKRSEGPNDLPAEYLNSSLAQQSQVCLLDCKFYLNSKIYIKLIVIALDAAA